MLRLALLSAATYGYMGARRTLGSNHGTAFATTFNGWDEAKAKAPAGTKIVEVDADATPDDEGVNGFPTMKLKKADGTETTTSGQKQSGDEILKELGAKTGGSKRRRRTHRSRHRKLLRRTLRNYVAF